MAGRAGRWRATRSSTHVAPARAVHQNEWVPPQDGVSDTAGDASSRLCRLHRTALRVTGPVPRLNPQPSALWKMVVLRDPADDDLAVLGFVMKPEGAVARLERGDALTSGISLNPTVRSQTPDANDAASLPGAPLGAPRTRPSCEPLNRSSGSWSWNGPRKMLFVRFHIPFRGPWRRWPTIARSTRSKGAVIALVRASDTRSPSEPCRRGSVCTPSKTLAAPMLRRETSQALPGGGRGEARSGGARRLLSGKARIDRGVARGRRRSGERPLIPPCFAGRSVNRWRRVEGRWNGQRDPSRRIGA